MKSKLKVKERIGKNLNGITIEIDRWDEKGNNTYKKCKWSEGEFIHMQTFDDHGNILIDEISAPGLENCNTYTYKYDKNNHIIKETLNKGESITIYQYDKKGRLTKSMVSGNPNCHYYYDEHNNLSRIIQGAVDVIIENDDNGNCLHYCARVVGEEGLCIQEEYCQEFDSDNNIIHYKSNELESWYEYNFHNNLICEKNTYSEKSGEENNEVLYEYNDDNELIRRIAGDEETFYQYKYYEN